MLKSLKKHFCQLREHLLLILDAHNEPPIIHSSKRHLGIFATLSGYLFYAVYTINYQDFSFKTKGVNKEYTSFFEMTLFYFVMAVVSCVFCSLKGKEYFKCKKPSLIFYRGLLGVLLLWAYSLARTWTSNVDNSMLYSTDALWIVILLALFGMKSPLLAWLGVLIGFFSIGFIWWFDFSSIYDIVGGGLGTLSGVLLAIITFMTRYMVRRDPPLRIMFYNSLIGVVLFGLITCYFGMRHGWHLPNPSFIPVAIFEWYRMGSSIVFLFGSILYNRVSCNWSYIIITPIFCRNVKLGK